MILKSIQLKNLQNFLSQSSIKSVDAVFYFLFIFVMVQVDFNCFEFRLGFHYCEGFHVDTIFHKNLEYILDEKKNNNNSKFSLFK